ncbi:MAG: sensor histidine kinase [Breznakia sp.]
MWGKLFKKIKNKRFFIQISLTAGVSVIITTITVSLFVINMSEDVYLDAYKDFNHKIMNQVSNEYYQLHEDTVNILTSAQESKSMREYFTKNNASDAEEGKIIYQMQKQLANYRILNQKVSSNIMSVGLNGKKYAPGAGAASDSASEILASDIIQDAILHADQITYYHAKEGYTDNTKGEDVIMAVKVLRDYSTKAVYGVAIITMSEEEFASYYESLIDGTINKLYCIDQNGKVMSSNDSDYKNTKIEDINNILSGRDTETQFKAVIDNNDYALEVVKLPFMGFRFVSLIDESSLMAKINFLPSVIIFALAISISISIIVIFLIRKYFHPLNEIIEHVPAIIEGDFDNSIQVQSSGEIMELAEAFNYMLEGLNTYVDNVVKLESEKKLAEIHALQMQINPHFVYNTLTSIKFLMWQNKNKQAIEAMDAFIQLLRNTLSSDDEYGSVQSEINSLKNYVMIQNIRYNDKVSVSYHIKKDSEDMIMSKMLLQPFVENAFFHAFTGQENATINIFASIKNGCLIFEIIDNGAGMDIEKVKTILINDEQKKKGLSGLGIKNVNNRIKLLYGDDYGVKVSSIMGQGTMITIVLPLIKKEGTKT